MTRRASPPTPQTPGPQAAALLPHKLRRNQNGQTMGVKGHKTRRRVIDATVTLLETVRLRDLRVADIAQAAETSPATFYLYFSDVTDVVLAAIGEVSQSTPALLELMNSDWRSAPAIDFAHALVETYLDFWHHHRIIFRVRNLAAEEGDERFIAARELSIRPLLNGLAAHISRSQSEGRVPSDLHPLSTAGVVMAMLERLAVTARAQSGRRGISYAAMVHAAAHMIALTISGGRGD